MTSIRRGLARARIPEPRRNPWRMGLCFECSPGERGIVRGEGSARGQKTGVPIRPSRSYWSLETGGLARDQEGLVSRCLPDFPTDFVSSLFRSIFRGAGRNICRKIFRIMGGGRFHQVILPVIPRLERWPRCSPKAMGLGHSVASRLPAAARTIRRAW
jgi:hypothetical protein